MKKDEIKKDPIAEKLISAIQYSKNNSATIMVGLIVIASIIGGLSYYQNLNDKYQSNSKLAVDEIMIQLINNGLNNPDYYTNTLSSQIDSIYKLYPDSRYINYLAFIVNNESSDSTKKLVINKINSIKNSFENNWFKTQAYIVAGDYYADNNEYQLAKNEYSAANKYSDSNAQKGYSSYKLGNIHMELEDYSKALSSYEKASDFFDQSKDNAPLTRNQQYSSWVERNSIALSKVKNLLKK
ncbi:hypothetical protein DBW61_01840 [bacterium]|nr:MAG: hypothetical protein DBW61_01840 [bacterium]|tara:strand:- start:7140 stop:7859 length:720 start_codon:yes stop_codon:yes gene_type:complete